MAQSTLSGIATPAALRAGQIVAGRFAIVESTASFGPLVVYRAKDNKTQKDVSVWAAPQGMVRPELSAAVRAAVRIVTTLKSPDFLAVFGLSVDPATSILMVATEPLPPKSALDLLNERGGQPLTLAEAHAIVAPLMDAMVAAHAQNLAHGAIAPVTVRVTDEMKGRLAGLGLGPLLVASKEIPDAFLAPEIRRGVGATTRSDIYALGALFFTLCTGKNFDPTLSATELVPSLPITFDVIIENSTAESPDDRFKSLTSMKAALAALVAAPQDSALLIAVPPPTNDPDFMIAVDVEPVRESVLQIHMDIDMQYVSTAGRPSAMGIVPFEGARPSMVAMAPSSPSMPSGQASIKGLVDQAIANDAPRWMFVRNGLDHGPLTARELIQAIIGDEVRDNDIVFNMDTSDRKKLTDWPQYKEFAEQSREKRNRQQHEHEVKSAIAEDTVNARAKVLVGVATVAAVGILFGVYWKTLGPGSASRRQAELDIPRPNARAVGGALEVLPPPPPDEVRRNRGGGGGGGGGGFTSYESAMSQPIDFNFAGGSGPGGGTLQDREIVGPLNSSLGRFASCAAQGAPGDVRLRIAVGGTGQAIGVTIANGSAGFKGCVMGVVRSLRWRAFGGPRVGFAWGFSVQ